MVWLGWHGILGHTSKRLAQPDGLQQVAASGSSVQVELAQSVVAVASIRPFASWVAQKAVGSEIALHLAFAAKLWRGVAWCGVVGCSA